MNISCLIDGHPSHHYQIIRLLESLPVGKIDPKTFYALVTTDVKIDVVYDIKSFGVNVITVDVFHPSVRTLNKIQQFYIKDLWFDECLMLDCDVEFLRPFDLIEDTSSVAMSPCMYARPNADIFNRYLESIGMKSSGTIMNLDGTCTIIENLNGGVRLFPGHLMEDFIKIWKKWTLRVLYNDNILPRSNHDQTTFAVALIEYGIVPTILDDKYNYHNGITYDKDIDPIIYHHHDA